MNPIDVTDSELLCLAIVLISFFGAPILAEMIASAIRKIKTPFRKQEQTSCK